MSNDDSNKPRLFSIDPVTRSAIGRITRREHCGCLSSRTRKGNPRVPVMHLEPQADCAGWEQVRGLVARLADGCPDAFEPIAHVPWEDWMRVITLPPEIAKLTEVTQIRLYGSHLRRLPPEIGRLTNLADLDIYTSYSLHWLPYEVRRCSRLKDSRMSTRALYGNRKTRLPFPRLGGPVDTLLPKTCSVCDQPFGEKAPHLFWTTQVVGTDIVPLLAHTCSAACTDAIPDSPPGYFGRPHKGGDGVGMPDPEPDDWRDTALAPQLIMPAPQRRDAGGRSARGDGREARMKYLRIGGAIVGALCALMGGVWIFQGINVIPGSFMTGDVDWSYRGGVLAVVGLVVLFLCLRKPRANGS